MTNKRLLAGAVLIFGLFSVACNSSKSYGNDTAAINAAIPAATSWLELIDQGGYEKSWTGTAPIFKLAISQSDWGGKLRADREPLGNLISRTVQSCRYATELPGAPDGEYVVIQFETVFEHKAHAIETVTPMLDKDGSWKPAGYYIN